MRKAWMAYLLLLILCLINLSHFVIQTYFYLNDDIEFDVYSLINVAVAVLSFYARNAGFKRPPVQIANDMYDTI